MRVINVKIFLDIEASIRQEDFSKSKANFLEDRDDATTAYAILSHRWRKEVNYNEMVKLLKMQEEDRNELRQRDGYRKICDSCEQAAKDGFQWLWVDTCCIDKRSSAELSEAINSMYRWYENSTKCYVYLHDVDGRFPSEPDDKSFPNFNGWPEWFSRGWTLQELIAPKDVEFFNKGWEPIGTKRQHTEVLSMITRVPRNVLIYGLRSHRPCVAQIMSWAADRTTTRVEDRAYSLLGLFDVHMPMLYGEGKGAFQRLQLEIIRIFNDHSIFAWDPERKARRAGSVLAEDPGCFRDCNDVKKMSSRAFMTALRKQFMPEGVETPDAEDEQLNVFSVTNGGIQIWLPTTPYRNHPSVCRVALACSLRGDPVPITIDLVYADEESNYSRYGSVRETPSPLPGFEFRKLYLSYRDDVQRGSITLDDRTIFYYGFKRCGSYPREVANDSIPLPSLTHDPVVVVYANDNVRIRFSVGFEDRLGKEPVQVFWDEPYVAGETWPTWEAYAEGVYHQMRGARSRTSTVPKLSAGESSDDPDSNSFDSFIKHVHLPRSICAAKIILSRRNSGNHTVTVDIDQCTGCCHSPLEWKPLGNTINELDLPGLMAKLHTPFTRELYVDGIGVQFRECGSRTAILSLMPSDGVETYSKIFRH
ncbi:heterokaryon incompatibility protein-domain-containing protein [Pisolithus albus]|nr:heterokaryon incompatibility protein-domain-containing protein [Pisolithus albus]